MTADVVRLLDRVPIAVDDPADLHAWATKWLEFICKRDVRSLVIVVQEQDGSLYKVSQSTHDLKLSHLIGLLTMVSHRAMDGKADPPV